MESLLRPIVTQYDNKSYVTINGAFQVIAIEERREDNGVILAVWNGAPLADYPPARLFKLEEDQFGDQLRKIIIERHHYTRYDLEDLYNDNKLMFICAYGSMAIAARTLKPMDIFVAYNILVKPDENFPGYFSYVLYHGDAFGRIIRPCSNESLMGWYF